MGSPHPASRAEDLLNAVVARHLARRGWRERILPFIGYGSSEFARVIGRVVISRPQDEDALSGQEDLVHRGFRAFLAAPLTGIPVTVEFGDARVELETDRGGYFDVELTGHGITEAGWHEARISTALASGIATVQLIGADVTFGIISDIDDTCLVTSLPRPMIAAWNTFVLEENARKVVPGMPAMYRSLLAHKPGAPIIYLSTGAWNTQPNLTRFLRRHGFPLGALLLTDWGPTEERIFRSGQEHKARELRRLAREFPHIKWLLVGDDGQHDPRIYEEFAVEGPDHVEGIAIRQLTATQQLLAHGYPLSHDDLSGRQSHVMVYEGPDGYTLHRLVQSGRLTRDADQSLAPPTGRLPSDA